jgi:hypothetical protein
MLQMGYYYLISCAVVKIMGKLELQAYPVFKIPLTSLSFLELLVCDQDCAWG